MIAQQHTDSQLAAGVAESWAVSKDQIWGGEGYTLYVFNDNSILAQSGPEQIAVDADDPESVQAYVQWLGDDAPLDQQRLDEIIAALA
ncbi:hypothetical protein EA655_05420 [Pseudoxanthomonas winnipegensis]|uniref:Uncharacterized protein n=1 Tax=Pseudoxanthomonas winnipegensis TaxID=2480810 RepID=A0A4Q8M7F2_9GAMM|nr:hypothetical protein EA655_05420 [Pseudoxanthomonas winnipegensis]